MLRSGGKQVRRQYSHSATLSEASMSSDLYGELADAGRTALEIVRRQRAGDLRGIVDLVNTYGDGGKALIFGAMASVVNHALAAFDELAREHGEVLRSEDLLDAMAIGLQPPGPGLDHG
jgi:hypothetical protein